MSDSAREILDLVLGPRAPSSSAETSRQWSLPVEQAIAAGFHGERVGDAFVGGYQAALRALVPDLPSGRAVLCATEERGVQPSAIQSSLTPATSGGYTLNGKKRWATGATHSDWLLVVASTGVDERGRSLLGVACIPSSRAGVTLHPMPPMPFVPEIGHAEVTLAGVAVAVEELLPGDGWTRYLKPFRTVEDIHVHAALGGYLARVARDHEWPRPVRERLAALLVTLRALGREDPSSLSVHIALGGALAMFAALIEETNVEWQRVDAVSRDRWQRDAPLLLVASSAPARRLEKAWERIGS